MRDRGLRRALHFRPITVEERLASFQRLNYQPYGLYIPDSPQLAEELGRDFERVGAIESDDERLRAYYALQAQCERWVELGVPGVWTGQQAVARSGARFRVVGWGRRGGKSLHASREALGVALIRPGAWVWVAAPTFKLVSRVFDMIMEMIRDLGIEMRVARNVRDERLVELFNGSKIEGISLDNLSSAAGAAVDFAVVDEARYLSPEAINRAIMPPLVDKCGHALFISSLSGKDNYFTQQLMFAKRDKTGLWEGFQGESWQNFYWAPQGRESRSVREAALSMSPLEFLEEFGAIPMAEAELVYPQYKEQVHVVDYQFDARQPVYLAIDPSSGANEYAVVALQDYGDVCYVFDEFYRAGVLAEEAIEWARTQPWSANIREGVIDSANPSEIERWVNAGFNVYAVEDKPRPQDRYPLYRKLLRDPIGYQRLWQRLLNDYCRENNLALRDYERMPATEQRRVVIAIEERLGQPSLPEDIIAELRRCSHLFIARSCIYTQDEHANFAFQKRRDRHNAEERARQFKDHIMDCISAGTLVATDRGSLPIEQVRPGMRVLTRQGYKPVLAAWCANPAAVVWEVRTTDDSCLVGTPDHRVWVTGRGWVRINELRVGDRLCSPKPSRSRALFTTAIQRLRTTLTAAISTTRVVSCSTAVSGLVGMGRSQPAATFTTATATPATTPWTTSNVAPVPSTSVPTSERDLNGSWSACSVASPTSPPVRAPISSTARGAARLPRGAPAVWMTRIAAVRSAAVRFVSAAISVARTARKPAPCVVAIARRMERSPVYDLTVADAHEFFAGGLLVHNCLGYYAWTYKRWDFPDGVERVQDFIPQRQAATLTLAQRTEFAATGAITPDSWRYHFLHHMRRLVDDEALAEPTLRWGAG